MNRDSSKKSPRVKGENTKLTLWERYLTGEIAIEFKACLYFFAVLFFYCLTRMIGGSFDARILHMAEMILTCYIIGYLQVYAFANFDEADRLGGRECAGMGICTGLYCAVAHFCGWFEGSLVALGIFAVYILVTYVCVFLIYKTKRSIDDKKLNADLLLFQTEHKHSRQKEEEEDR